MRANERHNGSHNSAYMSTHNNQCMVLAASAPNWPRARQSTGWMKRMHPFDALPPRKQADDIYKVECANSLSRLEAILDQTDLRGSRSDNLNRSRALRPQSPLSAAQLLLMFKGTRLITRRYNPHSDYYILALLITPAYRRFVN